MSHHVFGAAALALAAVTALLVIRELLQTRTWTDGHFLEAFERLPSQARNRVGLVLVLGGVGAVFLWARPAPPPANSVDGTYSNPCCVPIRLQNGTLIAGSNRVAFTLSRMKFGLVALPGLTVDVGPDSGIRTRREKDPAMIAFDGDEKGFTLAGPHGGIYDFRRLP